MQTPPVPTSSAAAPPSALPLWRTSPARLGRLLLGTAVFGVGEGLVIRSTLGNSPWSVFAEGVSVQTPLTIGQATILTGIVIFALWVPLRVLPGLGTVLNIAVIGLALDATVLVVPEPEAVAARVALLLGGIATVGVGSGLYLGTAHGPGPRDGLMTGLHRRTGRPIALVRGLIEVTALTTGWLLGGTLGIGTVAFALLIGPAVQAGIAVDARVQAVLRARSSRRTAGGEPAPAAATPD